MNLTSSDAPSRRRLRWEIAIVLALGLGQSAVYAIVQLAYRLTSETPLGQQTATLNPARSDREVFDLVYQLLGIGFSLVPILLVCFLLWNPQRPHLGALGLDGRHPWRDTASGVGLVLAIGVPGLAFYLIGRSLELFVAVDPGAQAQHWWTIPVLLLAAARASLTEEIVVLGYLFARLRTVGWSIWPIIIATSILRASYHLYQGPGAFLGNLAMGLLFGWLFARTGRLMPFLVAHFLIDAAVFVGYPWAAATWPAFFGLPG
ncbi:membrane protease YdiL (CAAX protease family) [Microbacterium keratanolyticum]|uniref:CAAX amino protease n=1 Tax=Microbacterium keratanolyticum TaxID=67574 RepID=A0A9W6M8V9_9MICO|nr:CPBP family intramembrane glutamic endopeptidase [Microbacterium keratanolyticum]MBM7469892.1 membrane protease YdiL (CAAX protease family) [Microbacterium keratanolyticum]GLK01972.1 CAAX amino protease [Microbacterium keratanolyticum]